MNDWALVALLAVLWSPVLYIVWKKAVSAEVFFGGAIADGE